MTPLLQRIVDEIAAAGGWIDFSRYMALALYTPGLGYYARGATVFGQVPQDGSDFVTAPELSPLFGAALAAPLAEALRATGTDTLYEFGAGSGALAAQLLPALQACGVTLQRYVIVDLSGALRARQAERLAPWSDRVQWLDALPPEMAGVVIGNEVLDAMPVSRLYFDGERWWARGVAWDGMRLVNADRPSPLAPPCTGLRPHAFVPGTVTEVHPQSEAFIATLADRLVRGAAFFIDYGFPEAEYYHPQRLHGTLVAHRAHRVEMSDADLLAEPGEKDLTAHVNFTAVALAAQEAGLHVLGYTSQAHFLFNAGLLAHMEAATPAARSMAHRLVAEHEMGELFKVIGLTRGEGWASMGFAHGDRTHTL